MMTAIFIWANTASAVVGASLSLRIVAARANNDKLVESQLFATAFFFAIASATALIVVFQAILNKADLSGLFGLKNNAYDADLRVAALYMSFLLPINIVASLSDSAQAGYQRQYVTNVLMMASNVAVIASLVWVQTHPSIHSMVLAVFAPPVVARTVNMALLWRSHPHIVPRWRLVGRRSLWSLVNPGAGFALMQVGSFAYLQYPIFYVGREIGPNSAAYFAAMMQVIAMSGSFLILFTQPLLPALRDASVRNDSSWTRNTFRLTLTRLVPYIAVAAIAIVLLGTFIISVLLRHSIKIDLATRLLWAAFFFIVAWEHLGYSFLAGIGKVWLATGLYLAGALLMLIIMVILIPKFGIIGAFAAMCSGPILSTVLGYPYVIKRYFMHTSS
ncbi:polysaccharide biosynthesis C-terminal domain-containing protein [Pandoraea sp.]|uniref:polysaccharide biosynthesis C-terminal domain-containing protein n=1 Tax=Pandoraea sp. TaxID=1883445 RepID=UPI0035B09CF1